MSTSKSPLWSGLPVLGLTSGHHASSEKVVSCSFFILFGLRLHNPCPKVPPLTSSSHPSPQQESVLDPLRRGKDVKSVPSPATSESAAPFPASPFALISEGERAPHACQDETLFCVTSLPDFNFFPLATFSVYKSAQICPFINKQTKPIKNAFSHSFTARVYFCVSCLPVLARRLELVVCHHRPLMPSVFDIWLSPPPSY